MQTFLDARIAYKLFFSFSIFTLLLILSGIFSVHQINRLHELTDRMASVSLPSTQIVLGIKSNVNHMRIQELEHITASSIEEMSALEREIASLSQEILDGAKQYEKLIADENEKKLWAEFNQAWSTYYKHMSEVIRLSQNNNDTEAKELVRADSDRVFHEALDHLDTLSNYVFDNATRTTKDSQAMHKDAKSLLLIGLLVSIVISICLAFFMGRNISQPLQELAQHVQGLGKGDLRSMPVKHHNDEVGMLACSLGDTINTMRQTIGDTATYCEKLEQVVDSLSAITQETNEGMLLQKEKIKQMSNAMNEMVSSVGEVARSAGHAAELAKKADQTAREGQVIVLKTTETISRLSEEEERAVKVIEKLDKNSNNIGMVIDVIRSIAEQTNLLALNAAIEAARAGEQGRGFAVVADEVRNLASKTQQSTSEIKSMIDMLQNGAKEAVGVMTAGSELTHESVIQAEKAGNALKAITQAVAEICVMNTQIASAAEQQTAATEEINTHLTGIEEISKHSMAAAQQTQSSADELNKLAGQLRVQTKKFTL